MLNAEIVQFIALFIIHVQYYDFKRFDLPFDNKFKLQQK